MKRGKAPPRSSTPPRIEERVTPVNGVAQPPVEPPPNRPGRLTNQLVYLRDVLIKAIWEHPFAWPFYNPVDAIKLNLPDYHEIIKTPMDLGTIKMRLINDYYRSGSECLEDFSTMFKNCITYNNPSEDVVVMAQTLQKVYQAELLKMPKEDIQRSRKRNRPSNKTNTTVLTAAQQRKYVSTKQFVQKQVPHAVPPVARSQRAPKLACPVFQPNCMTTTLPIKTENVSLETNGVVRLPTKSKSLKMTSSQNLKPTQSERNGNFRQPNSSAQVTKISSDQHDFPHAIKTKTKRFKVTRPLRNCQHIVEELFSKEHSSYAWPFYKPFDIDSNNTKDYYDIIKRPIDLGAIKRKLRKGKYCTKEQFADDMRLMLSNCYKYYSAGHDLLEMARRMHHFFEAKFSKITSSSSESGSSPESINKSVDIKKQSNSQKHVDSKKGKEKPLKVNGKSKKMMPSSSITGKPQAQSPQGNFIGSAYETDLKMKSCNKKTKKLKTLPKAQEKVNPTSAPNVVDSIEENDTPLSYTEKRQLSLDINAICGTKLGTIYDLIQSREQLMCDASSGEVIIDLEKLKPTTMNYLRRHIAICRQPTIKSEVSSVCSLDDY